MEKAEIHVFMHSFEILKIIQMAAFICVWVERSGVLSSPSNLQHSVAEPEARKDVP